MTDLTHRIIQPILLLVLSGYAVGVTWTDPADLPSDPVPTIEVAVQLDENDYSELIAAELDGQTQVRTPDGSYVDILTDDYAYEVEYAAKWKEAPGQATFYALATNRRPAVMLLYRGEADKVYYLRCLAVCARLGIRLETWRIDRGD